MSYTPTIWATKDKITHEKLNHLEQGLFDVSEQASLPEFPSEPGDYALKCTISDEGTVTLYWELQLESYVMGDVLYSSSEIDGDDLVVPIASLEGDTLVFH